MKPEFIEKHFAQRVRISGILVHKFKELLWMMCFAFSFTLWSEIEQSMVFCPIVSSS